MAKTLEELFGYVPLLKALRQPVNGVPMPEGLQTLMTLTNDEPIGDQGAYPILKGTGRTAKFTPKGAPHRERSNQDIQKKPVRLVNASNKFRIPQSVYVRLSQINAYASDPMGQQYVEYYSQQHRTELDNLVTISLVSVLSRGVINVSADGSPLPSSVGEAWKVDFEMDAGHQGQLDVFGTGNLINVLWSDVNAPIAQQIKSIRDAGLKESGLPITTCYYGRNVFQYIMDNNRLAPLAQNPAYYAGFQAGEIPSGFLGLKWVPINSAFFQTDAGVTIDMWDEDLAVFTPDPNREWFELLRGQSVIPSGVLGQIFNSGPAANEGVMLERGMYQYALRNHDPVTLDIYYGYCWLPCLTNPKAIFQATVA